MGFFNLATLRLGPAAATLFSVAGLALASQPGAQPTRPSQPPPPGQAPLLRGPAVQESGIPGTERAFTMEEGMRGPQARMLNREIPMNEFMGALRALNAPETPETLHLSPEQREALAQITREHAEALRRHMASHRQEIAALGQTLGFEPGELQQGEQVFGQRIADAERRARRAVGVEGDDASMPGTPSSAAAPAEERARARTGRPGAPDDSQARAVPRNQGQTPRSPEQIIRERIGDNPTPEQRDAIARLREIRAGGPSALDAQTRAWNVLSDPQREFVQARLAESRERLQERQGEMYVQEMVQQRGGPDAARQPPGPPGAAAERLHRLIDELSPQEQEMLLRMLENRLPQLRARGAQGLGQPQTPGRRPAPPTMEEVDVPPPNPI